MTHEDFFKACGFRKAELSQKVWWTKSGHNFTNIQKEVNKKGFLKNKAFVLYIMSISTQEQAYEAKKEIRSFFHTKWLYNLYVKNGSIEPIKDEFDHSKKEEEE